jgi:hypothetical protein
MERKDWNMLIWIVAIFAILYFVPSQAGWFKTSILSAFDLLHDYAQKHVLTCLIPALFIAGAIAVFVKKDYILKYLGDKSRKIVSYSIASVSGAILAVCSCTILPLFVGIRKRGAGLGPAITFLFAGPAINIAAIFLTMSVLGLKIGLARIISAILLSILVGLTMAFIFREKTEKGGLSIQQSKERKVPKKILFAFFGLMIGILVVNGLHIIQFIKYVLMLSFAVAVALLAIFKFHKESSKEWLGETWNFSKMLLPLLFIGVFIAGFIMPLLPQTLIEKLVGQNSIIGNLTASIFGAFMYFATLTEIPIMQALIAKGMSSGPALALLLSGPSLSLPSMIVLRRVLGTKKTAVYIALVIIYSTIAGLIFGSL